MAGLNKVEIYLNVYHIEAGDYKRQGEGKWELSTEVEFENVPYFKNF
jgi:hypothetical protein